MVHPSALVGVEGSVPEPPSISLVVVNERCFICGRSILAGQTTVRLTRTVASDACGRSVSFLTHAHCAPEGLGPSRLVLDERLAVELRAADRQRHALLDILLPRPSSAFTALIERTLP